MVYTPFMLSVLAWERYEVQTNSRLPAFSAVKHAIIAESRNDLVRQFLKHDARADWLWILDPDIVFQPDVCSRLFEVAHPTEAAIVAAAYWNEYDDGNLCLTWHAQTEEGLRLFRRLPDVNGGIEIGSCGMGCTLIHRGVFEAFSGNDPWRWFGHDLIGGERAGEDVTFCQRARALGFRTVGHCGVTVEHFKAHYIAHGEGHAD